MPSIQGQHVVECSAAIPVQTHLTADSVEKKARTLSVLNPNLTNSRRDVDHLEIDGLPTESDKPHDCRSFLGPYAHWQTTLVFFFKLYPWSAAPSPAGPVVTAPARRELLPVAWMHD
uniref:Uncharacterized protein n=1 Tax=Mycena chlorophos TaxID=658473 RepID=A0ABQ0LNC1_MYCCL|nr:predicted protein [Mycena chlorophos]